MRNRRTPSRNKIELSKISRDNLPVGSFSKEDLGSISNALCNAENHKVRETQSAGYAVVHELLSEAPAIVGTIGAGIATTAGADFLTVAAPNLRSLAFSLPILGTLVWERISIGSEKNAISQIKYAYDITQNPGVLHAAGLEFEGIPKLNPEALQKDDRTLIKRSLEDTCGRRVVKRARKVGEKIQDEKVNLHAPNTKPPKKEGVFKFLLHTAQDVGHIFYQDKELFKGGKEIVAATATADIIIAKQLSSLAVNYTIKPAWGFADTYLHYAPSYIMHEYAKPALHAGTKKFVNSFAKPAWNIFDDFTYGALTRFKDAHISPLVKQLEDKFSRSALSTSVGQSAALPAPPTEEQRQKERQRIRTKTRNATIQSVFTGASAFLQKGFIGSESFHGVELASQGDIQACFHFMAALVAARPLEVLCKRHEVLDIAICSDRARLARVQKPSSFEVVSAEICT